MTKPQNPDQVRVLVADDDAGLQRLLSLLFAREGWIVEQAWNGAETLDKIGVFDPDVVLLDLMMPEVSGFDVLARIRGVAPAVLRRIIVMTAASPKLFAGIELADIHRLLRKPFDIVEVLAEVTACAGQRQHGRAGERTAMKQ